MVTIIPAIAFVCVNCNKRDVGSFVFKTEQDKVDKFLESIEHAFVCASCRPKIAYRISDEIQR